MSTDAKTNAIARARALKADKLVHVLKKLEVSSEGAARFTITQRDQACEIAGVRTASDETWALVVELLQNRSGGSE